ncbi:MAG: glycosyltransferase family 4 protein [Thermaurantimonas sp.]
MKVVQLVPSPARTGPVTVAHELVRLLRPYADIQILYFDSREGYQWPDSKRISFSAALSEIQELECDILHSHTLRPDVFSALRKFVRPKLKTISTLHNYFYDEYRLEYPKISALAGITLHHLSLKNKNALVAITPHMQRFYTQKGFAHVHYIPNTRIPEPISPDHRELADKLKSWSAGATLLMTLGTANERKNLHAVVPLLLRNTSWKWIHVGDGKLLPALKMEIRQKNLENRVCFTGFIREGHQLLQIADVLLLPSLSEGFPLVLLESFQLRIPVVCNRIQSFEGLFSEELVCCEVHDANEFAKSVEYALENRDCITSKAIERFDKEFSPSVIATQYVRLYESLG